MPKISAEFAHSVGSALDYGFTWVKWLRNGESIISSSWAIQGTLTKGAEYSSGGICTVFVSGLTLGGVYRLTNTIVTDQGRTDSRTLVVSCQRR